MVKITVSISPEVLCRFVVIMRRCARSIGTSTLSHRWHQRRE